jgi:hypothetical protein
VQRQLTISTHNASVVSCAMSTVAVGLSLDIYHEATATPRRCGAKRNETAAMMECRTCDDQHAMTRVGIE